jgi:hypothetical protein
MKQLILIMGILSFLFGCKTKSKKETIVVNGTSINVTSSNTGNYKIDLADLTDEQNKFIQKQLLEAKEIIHKYHKDKIEKEFDSDLIDEVINKWRNDTSKDKKTPKEMIDIFGAAFGQGIVEELDCEWKLLSDQYGTDFTVINKKYVVNGFPFSTIQKVVTEDNPRSLNDIKLLLKNQIEQAEKTGKVDKRK